MTEVDTENLNVYEARSKIAEILKGTPGIVGYGANHKTDDIVIYVETENIKTTCEQKLKHIGELFFGGFTRSYYIMDRNTIHFS